MLSADFGLMDFDLNDIAASRTDLLAQAASTARDSENLCADVAAMIFPTASIPPSEEMLANVSMKLVALVRSIEMAVTNSVAEDFSQPASWQLLSRSGFLREPELIDFILARVAEDRLEASIKAKGDARAGNQLPAQLLDHSDPQIADAAQSLLAADSLHRNSTRLAYHALRPELLHQLCWRVVAALEVAAGAKNPSHIASAKALLADYDENATARTAARKLTHFAGDEIGERMFDPVQAGVHIFVSAVATEMGLDHDHVLRLIDTPSATPLSILLRGCGVARDDAMETLYLAKGFDLTPRDIALFDQIQANMSPEDAHVETARWAVGRAQQLLKQGAA